MSDPQNTQHLFPPTRWTQVIKLRTDEDGDSVQGTLSSLCEQYWYPLYAFARRLGKTSHDAQDLTQGFFCHILETNLFREADPEIGKMRTFLLHAFRRFITSQDRHQRALKRGGGQELVSLDVEEGEGRYQAEPADHLTPELLYERAWAHEVILQVHTELALQEEKAGRNTLFQELSSLITADGAENGACQEAAVRLGISHDAARQSVSRLRRRFRALLRQQIANTLHQPDAAAVDAELLALKSALTIRQGSADAVK